MEIKKERGNMPDDIYYFGVKQKNGDENGNVKAESSRSIIEENCFKNVYRKKKPKKQ